MVHIKMLKSVRTLFTPRLFDVYSALYAVPAIPPRTYVNSINMYYLYFIEIEK